MPSWHCFHYRHVASVPFIELNKENVKLKTKKCPNDIDDMFFYKKIDIINKLNGNSETDKAADKITSIRPASLVPSAGENWRHFFIDVDIFLVFFFCKGGISKIMVENNCIIIIITWKYIYRFIILIHSLIRRCIHIIVWCTN